MNPTRHQKNLVLVLANLLLVPIVALKMTQASELVGPGMTLWLVLVLPVALAALWTVRSKRLIQPIHIVLFLLTGTAIGLTGGAALKDLDSIWSAELFWLPIGIAAAIFHYWPSDQDGYQ